MRKLASVLFIGALLWPSVASTLGLGELTLDSFLNEPLKAEVELLELGDLDPSQVKVRLATREDFNRAGVEREYFLTSLRFEVQGDGDGARLFITSSLPVLEPYLNFIVEARWPTGRLLREYTVLLDPPVFVGSEEGITARAKARPSQPAQRDRDDDRRLGAGYDPETAGRSMPSRSYGAGATDAPISGEDYLVKRDDTLWSIAQSGRPAAASVQQTMLDIQRMNPEAFIGGNINRLKAGYVLRLPTEEDITPRSFEQAVAEVARQSERWQSGVSDYETRLDASDSLDYGYSSGSDRGDGHLQIAAGEDDAGAYDGDISARMDDLDRTRRENDDLSTQVGSLEQQLRMQERLISLKDEQISALQDALSRAGAEAPDLPEPEEEIGTIDMGSEPAVEDQLDAAGEMDAGEAGILEPLPETADTTAETTEPQQPAPRPTPPPPPPPTLLDTLMDNIIYVGAGLLVLLLGIGFLLRNKFKRGGDQPAPARAGSDDEDEFAGVKLSDDSLIIDEFADDVDEEGAEGEGIPSFSAPDEEAYAAQFETGDALAEADIYIAYGRFPQAVDLLKTAISVEPANTDYRMKLMEACVEMVDREEFQQQYADLQVIGDEHVLQRARDLLDAVDGGEVWLEDLPAPTISADDVAAAQAASAQDAGSELAEEELDGLDLGLDGDDTEDSLDLDLESDDDVDGELRPIEYEKETGAATESLDGSLEDDLESSLDDSLDELELDDAEDDLLAGGDELGLDELVAEDDDDGGVDLAAELGDLDIGGDDVGDDQAEDEISLPDAELDSGADDDQADDLLGDLDLGFDEGGDELTADEDLPSADEESSAVEESSAGEALSAVDELSDLEEPSADEEPSALEELSADDGDALDLSAGDDSEDLLDLAGSLESDAEPVAEDDDALDLLGGDDDLDLGDFGEEPTDSEGQTDVEAALDMAGAAADLGGGADTDPEPADLEPAPEEVVLDGLEIEGGTPFDDDDLIDIGAESDLDGADFGLDEFGSDDDLESMELDMSVDEADEDDEGLVFAANGDEVATKLDLARAYIDMGDHDGAKNILGEVIEEGSESQQSEAKSLLEGID